MLGPQWVHLPHRAARLFVFMALKAKDQDEPPRYYGGHDALVERLYDHIADDPKKRRWQPREVYKTLETLAKHGGIEPLKVGHKGTRQEFVLLVDPTTKGLFAVDRGALPGQWVHAARRAALVSRIRAW